MQPTWAETLTLRMEQALTRAAILDAELARERDPEARRELREAIDSWREEARRLEGRANRAHRRANRAKQGVK